MAFTASQPPTTIPPPTTEIIETTTVAKKIVNASPPIGQTTMFTINAYDKGEHFLLLKSFLFSILFILKNRIHLGSKYQSPSINEVENSEQKLTDTAKSVDWTGDVEKTNKGNCQYH